MPANQRFRVALVGPEDEQNLALRYLAAALSAAGFSCDIIPFNRGVELLSVRDRICQSDPPYALVGLSFAFQWRAEEFAGLAVALRERGYSGHITGGGHFGSFAYRELLRDFSELDSICIHEAEHTIVSLARAVQHDQPISHVPSLAFRGARRTAAHADHACVCA